MVCDMDDLATLVKRLRDEKGWTQADLATMVNRRQRWVSNVENGTTPRPDLMRVLASALDVEPIDLVIAADLTHRREKARQLAGTRTEADRERLAALHERFDDLLLEADPIDLQTAELVLRRGGRATREARDGSPPEERQSPRTDSSEP